MAGLTLAGGCDDPSTNGPGEEAFVQFSVRFVDAVAGTNATIAGVEVCVAERPDLACATSDADGRVSMAIPADTELLLRCGGANHGPAYMTWATGESDIDAGTFSLLNTQFQDAFVELAGAADWPAKGAITANIYEDLVRRDVRVEGATVTITPVGEGPTYVSDARVPDPDLSASTLSGPGVFYDVPAGAEVVVTISHPSRQCRGGFGWPGANGQSLRTRAYAGALANVTFVCPP